MFERFTDRARRVLVLAQEYAHDHNHPYIGTEHILWGITAEGAGGERGVGARILEQHKITPEGVSDKIAATLGDGTAKPPPNIPFTPRSKKVLELALREALQMGHSYIGTEHLLLGLVREGEGVGATILVQMGVEFGTLRRQIIEFIGAQPNPPMEESSGDFKISQDWIRTADGVVYIPVGNETYVKATFAIKPDGTWYKFKQIPIPTWVATS